MSYPRRTQHHAAPTMTRAQNRSAYKQWLTGCTDRALVSADPLSIGRSYGIAVEEITAGIKAELRRREMD